MNTTTWTATNQSAGWLTRMADYVELTKPRITVMVLVAVTVAGFVASWGQPDPWILLHTLIGTVLVAASASACNQLWERETDALMPRTADRPLPAGRLESVEVMLFTAVSLVVGTGYLIVFTQWTAAAWAMATWIVYVLIYTPLKRVTRWNTAVGAVSGAIPVLIGWTAVGGQLDLRAASLFMLLFLWQFPHFMAIAWIYRDQYESAGMRMATARGTGSANRSAGVQAVLGASALLPVAAVPALFAPSVLYLGLALVLGVGQLAVAIAFFRYQDDLWARRLLRVSVIYLPLLLLLLAALPVLS